MLMPGTEAAARRMRAITPIASVFRSGLSRSAMNMRPEFWVEAGPPPPTVDITHTGQEETVNGVRIVFQITPGTEAPSEMNFLFPDHRALCMAENATHNLHNYDELGVAWDDPEIGADWGVTDPVLSARDQKNPRRADLPADRRPHAELRT